MDLTTAIFYYHLLICLGFPQLHAWAGYATGERDPSLEFMRYAYASGTVYLFWIYAHSAEPGLGTNLQTFALVAVLAGRYYAYLFTTAWMAFEFAGTMVALAAYLYQSLARQRGRGGGARTRASRRGGSLHQAATTRRRTKRTDRVAHGGTPTDGRVRMTTTNS